MKLVPLYNKLVVDVIPENDEKKTASGIVMLSRPNPYSSGKVISVGNGCFQSAIRIPMDVTVGMTVRFLKGSGMPVSYDVTNTPTQIVLADTDIYAIEVDDTVVS